MILSIFGLTTFVLFINSFIIRRFKSELFIDIFLALEDFIKGELLVVDPYFFYEIFYYFCYIFTLSQLFVTFVKCLDCIVAIQNKVWVFELLPVFRLSFPLLQINWGSFLLLGCFDICICCSKQRFISFLTLKRSFDLVYSSLLADVCVLNIFAHKVF